MITNNDSEVIEFQLGRPPRGLEDISRRCPHGFPTVLVTNPLIREGEGNFELFPTVYWLSCPRLVEKVDEIESGGNITRLEKRLNSDPTLYDRYQQDELNYRRTREKLLTSQDRSFLETHGLTEEMNKGIGGIEDRSHLKCLHLHLAHYLSDSNIIGELIWKEFDFSYCPSNEVRCDRGSGLV